MTIKTAGETYGVWSIYGKDADDFLQRILTIDVLKLQNNQASYCTLLTPQGKIRAGGFLFRLGEPYQFYLVMLIVNAEDFLKPLMMYKLNSDVNFKKTDLKISITQKHYQPSDSAHDFKDPRGGELFWSIYTNDADPRNQISLDAYKQHLIQNKILEFGLNYPSNQYFIFDVGLDRQNAVSFKKGCYVGQEVVSRMNHKKTFRKGVQRFSVEDECVPVLGQSNIITQHGKLIGDMLAFSSTSKEGLGVVFLDRLQQALDQKEDIFLTSNADVAEITHEVMGSQIAIKPIQ